MDLSQITANGYILALFIRDDEERFLLGTGFYQFKQKQLHFAANTISNDVMEVQGNDGYLLAGQVRRPGVQSFDGYVGDGTTSKADVENYRRDFFRFFRKNYFYKVVYIFPNGKAIQRKRGFIVDDATVKELYQMYPEYHVALNFEDVNYYTYSEDGSGQEIYAEEADIPLTLGRPDGGLVWDAYGAVSNQYTWGGIQTVTGSNLTITNSLSMPAPYSSVKLLGLAGQQTYSGKNLWDNSQVTTVSDYVVPTTTGLRLYKTANGRITPRYSISLSANTTYVISCVSTHTTQNPLLLCQWKAEDNTTLWSPNIGNGTTTFTPNKNIVAVIFYLQNTETDGTYVEINNFQIEQGSTATSYEPYVGGIPAPNPDYPQPIQVVTGVQSVWVHGKNLLNPAIFDGIVDGGNGGYISSKYYTATTGVTFNLKPNTDYTISFRDMDGNLSATAWSISINGTWKSLTGGLTKITTDGNGTFDLKIGASSYGDIGTSERVIQLEEGSSATAYEPYQGAIYTIDLGSIELAKIGSAQDDIRYTNGTWVKYEAIGKITDGVGSTGITIPNMAQNSPVLSYCGGTVSGKTITYAEALTVANTIYYIKRNATGTAITDAGLIAQLNAFRNSKLAVGTNFISITPTSGINPQLQLSYYTTVTTDGAGYEWEAGTSGGATVVDVETIENVYPVWELQGPATNPTLTILSTNTSVTYTGTVSATQKLVVDMFNKTATLNGASVIGNISGDWVYLQSGNNRISYTASNSNAPDSKIYWQEIVG